MTTEHAHEPQEQTGHTPSGHIRRRFLAGAGSVAVAVAVALWPSCTARAATGKRVAVLGGGVCGLRAAHELAERGYAVTVYEYYDALGGKARSMPVLGAAAGGRAGLPAEHGFRFFPGFYRNLPDTMRRIPVPGNAHGVHDNLVSGPEALFARSGGGPTCTSRCAAPSPRRAPATSPSPGSATSFCR